MYIDFKGKAAHAGMYPWKGRIALGAVEILHRSSHGCGFTHILGLIGIMATLFVIVAIVSAFIVSLKQPWTKIVMRVAGSWVAAMGMLMFGWIFRGTG
jgi:cytochrome c biogenesis protein CcdA